MTITFGAQEERLPAFLLRGISAVRNARRKISAWTVVVLPLLGMVWLSLYIGSIPAEAFPSATLSGADVQRELLQVITVFILLYAAALPFVFQVRDAISGLLVLLCVVAERCIASRKRR